MQQTTRREFLKFSVTGAVALSASANALLRAGSPLSPRAWVTAKDRRFQQIGVSPWQTSAKNTTKVIGFEPSKRFQNILGFGAAFTDASCYLFNKMNAQDKQALLSDLFSPDGLGLSVARTCVGASDYATKPYSFDDSPEPDPELKHFTIEHDREYILPTLRAARKLNPDLFLFSSPWSPPGWMKAGGSLLGGSMRKKYYAPYANYFVKFLQDYSNEGVKINAITIQNEVDTDQDGRMPAALWGQEYEIEFVKLHLGPAFERASIDTKIWILDHNYNLWGRAIAELSDPGVSKYVDGVAWHGYMGGPDAMTKVHDAFPSKNAYWTEGGPDITSPDYAIDWSKWPHTFTGVLRNWSQCIVGWNLLLDEKGSPNIGPFPCGGLVTVDSKTGQLTRSGQYWAIAHFSKAIQRGAHVIGSQGEFPDIDHVALENPDGNYVLVVTNRGEKQEVSCQVGANSLTLELEPDSVTTLRW
jgi:glucosylceramidase